MKILMLTCMFMPEVYGGAEQQCFRQSKTLAARGHDVTILTARTKLSSPAREIIDGVNIRRQWTVKQPDLLGRYVLFSFLWIAQIIFFALRHRGQFEIIHCHQGKFGLYIGSLLAKMMHIPHIVKIGNSGEALDIRALGRKKLFGSYFLKKSLARAPHFVAISQQIVQDLNNFGISHHQIHKITNGATSLSPVYHPPSSKDIHFFWHGRFEPIKNLSLMLEGFSIARKINPHIKLALIGDGTEEEKLKALVIEMNLSEHVHFARPPENILDVISAHDIFINSSDAEGMSNSMLEALALGKAIISTPVSGTAEIIDEGKNGYIMRGHTARDVAQAITQITPLFADNSEEIFNYSIKKATEEFALEHLAEKYERLYEKLIIAQKQ